MLVGRGIIVLCMLSLAFGKEIASSFTLVHNEAGIETNWTLPNGNASTSANITFTATKTTNASIVFSGFNLTGVDGYVESILVSISRWCNHGRINDTDVHIGTTIPHLVKMERNDSTTETKWNAKNETVHYKAGPFDAEFRQRLQWKNFGFILSTTGFDDTATINSGVMLVTFRDNDTLTSAASTTPSTTSDTIPSTSTPSTTSDTISTNSLSSTDTSIPTSSSHSDSTAKVKPAESDDDNKAGIIAAAVIIPIIFILAVAAVLGYFVFFRNRRQRTKMDLKAGSDFVAPPIDPATLTIPITKLRGYIEKAKKPVAAAGTPTGFQLEYKHLEKRSDEIEYDFTSASAAHNAPKNRYQNVLAPERSRVKLLKTKKVEVPKEELTREKSTTSSLVESQSQDLLGLDESQTIEMDYVNANYVGGLIPGSERAYIASQGPMINILDDFWNLVWGSNVSIILMLTNEVENGRAKCDQYWPETDNPLVMDNYTVTHVEYKDDKVGIIVRKLKLEDNETKKTREVSQIHYVSWPDHGVPESTETFLELSTLTDEANHSKGPILVHCSAGIGRSGTFCLIHSTLKKIELDLDENPGEEPTINVVETTLKMRKDRGNMIQTVEQYEFGYDAIADGCDKMVKSLVRANPDKDYAVAPHFKSI